MQTSSWKASPRCQRRSGFRRSFATRLFQNGVLEGLQALPNFPTDRCVSGYSVGNMWRVLSMLAIVIAALAGGVVGFLPVFVMGLGVPLFVVGPLAIGTGALVASLTAGWVGNLAAPRRTRSRLLAIFAVSEAGAILFSLVSAGFWIFARLSEHPTPAAPAFTVAFARALFTCAVIFVFVVPIITTWRYRDPGVGRLGYDGMSALALSVVGLVVLILLVPVFGSGFDPGDSEGLVAVAGFVAGMTLAASGVALRARISRRGLEGREIEQDAALTLVLVGLWVAVVFVGTVSLTCGIITCQP